MDDSTIIKALRVCGNGSGSCAGCPFGADDYDCGCLGNADSDSAWTAAADRLEALIAENDRLTKWVSDLQSGMYVNCVYCGHRYGPDESTPVSMAEVLKQHVENCPKHPMSALKAERDAWKRRAEAAERDMLVGKDCGTCKHEHENLCRLPCAGCLYDGEPIRWEWRGPCAENGGGSNAPSME